MVPTWILILMIWTGSGAATTTAEFRTKMACEDAGAAALKEWGIGSVRTPGRFVCAPKG